MKRISMCEECTRRERCSLYKKNPEAVVSDCGRFKPTETMMQVLAEEFKQEALERVRK